MQLSLRGVVDDIEQSLYHGTAADSCDAINRRGFNRSYQRGMTSWCLVNTVSCLFVQYGKISINGCCIA